MPHCKLRVCLFIIIVTLFPIYCYRLPTLIIPEHYNIKIITYLDEGPLHEFYFIGRIRIKVKCVAETNKIILHSQDLNIFQNETKVYSVNENNLALKIINQKFKLEKDFFIIKLSEPLAKDRNYLIDLRYRAELLDDLAGYYRSSYLDSDKQRKWLATTHFEAISARKAFPCFDEPAMKAKFKLILGHRKHLTSISNMPLEKTEEMKGYKGWVWNKFQETVKMSTYLLAFVVSDFSFVSASNNMKIWARKNALDQVDFAKNIGPKLMGFFEKYFDIANPLPKEDMIAVPDFDKAAMENWGLITYREPFLLVDPETTSVNDKYLAAMNIGHELAHQWFGNLVTMKWWTDIWLNEGFATYMAYVALEALFPNWYASDLDIHRHITDVFALDSTNSTHPIAIPAIEDPKLIMDYFDDISYKKGSTIIRMMNLFLGDNVFNKGIRNYLKKYSYGNAEQDNLWDTLTEEAHKNEILPKQFTVKTIMDTWTLQTGYPVVNIIRNYETGIAKITQEQYFLDTKNGSNQKSNQCWWIPLCYTTKSEMNFNKTVPKLWLECPEKSPISVSIPNSNDWVIFNIQLSGLYRVNYDERNWKMLITFLKSKDFQNINALDRSMLIENVMELARTGRVSYDLAFDLIFYVKHDNNYLPWKTAIEKLNLIASYMERTAGYPYIKKYIKNLVAPIYLKLSDLYLARNKQDSINTTAYQQLITQTSCKYGVTQCREDAVRLFKQYREYGNLPKQISQDMLYVIYCEGLRNGSIDDWEFLFKKYKTSNVASQQVSILVALGCTENTEILNRYLEITFAENNSAIRTQDMVYVIESVLENEFGKNMIKTFFKTHLRQIANLQRLSYFFPNLISMLLNSKEELNEITDIMEKHNFFYETKSIDEVIYEAREPMEIIYQWHEDHYTTVEKLLRKYIDHNL